MGLIVDSTFLHCCTETSGINSPARNSEEDYDVGKTQLLLLPISVLLSPSFVAQNRLVV